MLQILSLIGFVLCFGSYLLNQQKKLTVDTWQYNWMTIIGCTCLLITAIALHSIGLILIQLAYGVVAGIKIVKLRLVPTLSTSGLLPNR